MEQRNFTEAQASLSQAEAHDSTAMQQFYLSLILCLARDPENALDELKKFISTASLGEEYADDYALILEVVAEESRLVRSLHSAIDL